MNAYPPGSWVVVLVAETQMSASGSPFTSVTVPSMDPAWYRDWSTVLVWPGRTVTGSWA